MEQEEKTQMYKEGIPLTEEQRETLKMLREAGKPTKALLKIYLEENYTDEYKAMLDQGRVEGVGIDLDDDEENTIYDSYSKEELEDWD